MRTLALAAALLCVASASAEPPRSTAIPGNELELGLFRAAGGKLMPVTDPIYVDLLCIPGSVIGTASELSVFRKVVSGDRLLLDLRTARFLAARGGEALRAKLPAGWKISDPDTQLCRLGTFAFRYDDGKGIGRGAAFEDRERRYLILIYADRPSRLSGAAEMDGEKFAIDAQFSQSGFYWLSVEGTAGDNQILNAKPPEQPRLVIYEDQGSQPPQ